MNKLIVILIMLFANSLFAQKIKVKKGVVMIDDKPAYKMDKKASLSSELYTISNLKDEKLFTSEYKRKFAYWNGPRFEYFEISDINKSDSCILDRYICSSPKKMANLINKYNLVTDDKFSHEGLNRIKSENKQDIIEEFMLENELTYKKFVERSPNAVITFSGEIGDKYEMSKKYGIKAGEKPNTKFVGYLQVENKPEGEGRLFKVYLPNALLVAIIHEYKAEKRTIVYETIYDNMSHSNRRKINNSGLQTIIRELVSNGYL